MPAGPEPFLQAIAPDRDDLVVGVEGLFTGYWLADLGARKGLPFVLGHALSRQAIDGGQANNDKIDAQKMAVWLRGGMRPHADGYPADRRAPRDRLRRRRHLMRKRAALLGPLQPTHRPSPLPDIGTKLADKANRHGGAARLADPAGPNRIEVDLARIGHDDELRRTGPGRGEIRSLVLLDDSHDIPRFPRGQDVVSSCRLVTGAKASAGTRSGTAGTTIGHAYRQGACSEAAVVFLRNPPPGQQWLGRREQKHGQGTAVTGLAHQRARAVDSL
jgi:hypothetical protein